MPPRMVSSPLLRLSVHLVAFAYALATTNSTTASPTEAQSDQTVGRLMIGVMLSVIGDLMCAASLCVQKVAHNKIVADGDKISYTQSPQWWGGLALNIFGEVGNFIAYSFAPAAVVAPVGAVGVVGNGVFAWYFLGEPLGTREIFGTAVVVVGVVFVVVGAPEGGHGASDLTTGIAVNKVYNLIVQPFQIVYFCLCIAAGVALFLASKKVGDKTVHCFTLLAADIGAYTVVSAKGVSTMVGDLGESVKTMTFYVGLIMLVFCAIVSTKFLNDGMHHFDNALVIPVYYCYFTLASIVGSSIMYREYEQMLDHAWKIPVFLLGVITLLGGVWIVTMGGQSAEDTSKAPPDVPVAGPSKRRRTTLAAQTLGGVLPTGLAEKLADEAPREYKHGRRSTFVPGGNLLNFAIAENKKETASISVPSPLLEDTTATDEVYRQMT